MLDLLYQTLILTGIIILLVLYYLKYTVSNFLKLLTEAIRMNEMSDYDPVKFIENLPPLMNKLGVESYSYYMNYHDVEFQKTAEHNKNAIKKFACAPDFTVYIEISPGRLRWEKSYLGILLVETIFLLMKIDVNLQLKAASKALSEYSKINTFLSHDIKNLAQFINIMEHNLSNSATPEKKDKLFQYLRETAPSIKMRSDRILFSLNESADEHKPQYELFALCDVASNIANILNVSIQCSCTKTEVYGEKKLFIIIFENIIKNFYDKSIQEPGIELKMSVIHNDGDIEISFMDSGSQIPDPERIFEPFYTDKKGGLGIGLYHCRNIANNMKGKLWAENTAEGPKFTLRIRETI